MCVELEWLHTYYRRKKQEGGFDRVKNKHVMKQFSPNKYITPATTSKAIIDQPDIAMCVRADLVCRC